MKSEEVAPPFERWPEHLKDLSDRDLAKVAEDYRWLDGEARPVEEREEFRRRREAVIAECERRDKPELSKVCRSD